jgi:carotenoid cleavage dioxygenase-like enzyme
MPRDRPVWESANWDEDAYSSQYVRFTMDPKSEQMTEPPKVMLSNRAPEFPIVPRELSTRRHRYAYTVATHKEFEPEPVTGKGSGPAGAIFKVDTVLPEKNEAYAFLPHEFVGEPCFVPKVGADVTNSQQEDRGYLLVHVIDGNDLTTDLVIFDVEGQGRLSAGPVARVQLPTYIPYALHGEFVEGLTFDF